MKNDALNKVRGLKAMVAGLLGRGRRAVNRFVRRPEEPPFTEEELADASAEQRDLVATCAAMDVATAGEKINQ
jgi:hypothetical protein